LKLFSAPPSSKEPDHSEVNTTTDKEGYIEKIGILSWSIRDEANSPVEFARIGESLGENEILVQILPIKDSVYFHLVSSRESKIKEVKTDPGELSHRADQTIIELQLKARNLRGIRVDKKTKASINLNSELHWLYGKLIHPIRNDIKNFRNIYVSTYGELCRIPFGALISTLSPNIEYAIEQHSFSYVPTLRFLDRIRQRQRRASNNALLVGDPDGSLEGAKSEVESLRRNVFADDTSATLIGASATLNALTNLAPRHGILHLATHGNLDPLVHSNSYLLLAGDRLTYARAAMLPLRDTELVVLSACESGRGVPGRDYDSMANAFAIAGASSVVATLWRIPDRPSAVLMNHFYEGLTKHENRFEALAQAQRAMIASKDPNESSPAAWGAFVPFGHP
jgi:CHAT domain-containing protein